MQENSYRISWRPRGDRYGVAMTKYRVWLSETEPLPVEVEADDAVQAQQKVEELLYKGTLWEETSIEMSEGCLEVSSVERV